MTDSGAERAARRIARRMLEIMRSRGLIFSSYSGQWDDVLKEPELAALISEETGTQEVDELLRWAWTFVPPDHSLSAKIGEYLQPLPAAPDGGGTR